MIFIVTFLTQQKSSLLSLAGFADFFPQPFSKRVTTSPVKISESTEFSVKQNENIHLELEQVTCKIMNLQSITLQSVVSPYWSTKKGHLHVAILKYGSKEEYEAIAEGVEEDLNQ